MKISVIGGPKHGAKVEFHGGNRLTCIARPGGQFHYELDALCIDGEERRFYRPKNCSREEFVKVFPLETAFWLAR